MRDLDQFLNSWLDSEAMLAGSHGSFLARGAVLDTQNKNQMFTGSAAIRLNEILFVNSQPRDEAEEPLADLARYANKTDWRVIPLPNATMIDLRSHFSMGYLDPNNLLAFRKSLKGHIRHAPKPHKSDIMITALRVINATHHRGRMTHAIVGMSAGASTAGFFDNPEDATEAYLKVNNHRLLEI